VALSGLKTRAQIGENLCWAATSEVLTNGNLEQCVSASSRFADKRHCCNKPVPLTGECDGKGWPPLKANGYSYSVTSKSWPSWEDLSLQLQGKSGVAVTQQYVCNSSAHIVTIIGTAMVGARPFAEFFDSSGLGNFVWSLYTPILINEPQYIQSRSYFKVTKPERMADAKCTAEDGIDGGCDEDLPTFDTREPRTLPAPALLDDGAPKPEARAAAQCGIALVRELGRQHPKSMGFASAAEAATAELSESASFKVAYMHTGADNRCTDSETNCPTCELFHYRVNGRGRGDMIVGLHEGTWQVVKMGGDPSAEQLASASPHSDSLAGAKPRTLLIVPELGVRLIQVGADQFLRVGSPTHDANRRFTLKQLRAELAKDQPEL